MPQNSYLNDEQMAQLVGQLESEGGLSAEQQQQAMQQGAEMAAQDMANAEAAAPAPDDATPPVEAGAQADPNANILAEFGANSVADLAEKLRGEAAKAGEYRQMLSTLLAFQQAQKNGQELDPTDPLHTVKQAVREEMAPVVEKLTRDAQNKLVQEAWGEAAKEMPDIADVMPEIAEFIKKNPELATESDGLRRAYDGVRSSKYRSEKQLFEDEAFLKKAAANEKVKELVLREHLDSIARTGEEAPATIGEGGNTPLTGRKREPDTMQQAKGGLLRMLGMK